MEKPVREKRIASEESMSDAPEDPTLSPELRKMVSCRNGWCGRCKATARNRERDLRGVYYLDYRRLKKALPAFGGTLPIGGGLQGGVKMKKGANRGSQTITIFPRKETRMPVDNDYRRRQKGLGSLERGNW